MTAESASSVPPVVPQEERGWKVVPVEPTEEMLSAMDDNHTDVGKWRDALAAAPKPQAVGEDAGGAMFDFIAGKKTGKVAELEASLEHTAGCLGFEIQENERLRAALMAQEEFEREADSDEATEEVLLALRAKAQKLRRAALGDHPHGQANRPPMRI